MENFYQACEKLELRAAVRQAASDDATPAGAVARNRITWLQTINLKTLASLCIARRHQRLGGITSLWISCHFFQSPSVLIAWRRLTKNHVVPPRRRHHYSVVRLCVMVPFKSLRAGEYKQDLKIHEQDIDEHSKK